jgi:ribosomal protein S18 acetylase RimI-like enzyme
MRFIYAREDISADDFADILIRSGLAERRPAEDLARLQRMLDHADLVVTARSDPDGRLVGIARSITDWSYATYLSDLAVDEAFKGRGIGKRLIDETRRHAGEETLLVLLSAPDAVGFYERLGLERSERAFIVPRAR